MTSDSVLLCLATYNEIENLPRLVDEIFRYLPQADLLVVDDNSPDGTGTWCERRAAQEPRLKCLHRPGKQGLGSAVLAALQYAVAHDYRLVINMDADFSHHPRYLPQLIAGMEPEDQPARDVMIGSRYVAGGGVANWPWHRRCMSRLMNGYARRVLGLPIHDCTGSFRCYRTATLRKLDFRQIRSRGYAFFEEILWHLQGVGANFGETPIIFTDRLEGQSKINTVEAIAAVGRITRLGLGPKPTV